MKRYYSVFGDENGPGGVAFDLDDTDMFLLSENVSLFGPSWKVIHFELREGIFQHYQPNDMAWHMCSEHLREVIERHAAPGDGLEWLPVEVQSENGRCLEYYLLHIPFRRDVLHQEWTTYTDHGHVIRPCIDARKAGDQQVFSYPDGMRSLFVSHDLKAAILEAGCSGITFSEVGVR